MRYNRHKIYMLIFLLFLTVGYALVSTNLLIEGFSRIGVNTDDFDVIFSKVVVDEVDVSDSVISSDGKTLAFQTKDLKNIGDVSILDFEVTNTSTQYDAEIMVNCMIDGEYSEYYSIKKSFPNIVFAKTTEKGVLRIILNKLVLDEVTDTFMCNMTATAVERFESAGDSVQLLSNSSIFNWSETSLLTANIDRTIEILDDLEINTIYHNFDMNYFEVEKVSQLVSSLRAKNIEVFKLSGEVSWYDEPDSLIEEIDTISSYNSVVGDNESITGVVFDVEAYLDENYKNDIVSGLNTYATTIETAYEYAKDKNIDMVVVLPYWFDEAYLDDEKYSESQQVSIAESIRKIYLNADVISIMNYYKTNMVDAISYEVALAKELSVRLESIAEFSRPKGDSIPESISLWVEDNPFDFINEKWNEISEEYIYNKLGFSYHYLESVFELYGEYYDYNFELLIDGEVVSDIERMVIRFDDGSFENVSVSKHAGLPKEVNYEFLIYGYNVVDTVVTDLGDNVYKYSLTIEKKQTYETELYVNLKEDGSYVDLTNGTVRIESVYFKDAYIFEKDINDEAYVYFSGVYADTEYYVSVTSSDGDVYTFRRLTGKDNDGESHDLTEGNVLIIPDGYKSNYYLVGTIFIKQEKDYEFTVIVDGENAYYEEPYVIKFADGTSKIIAYDETIVISDFMDFEVELYNYDVVRVVYEYMNNDHVNLRLIAKKKERYTLEIYPRIYTGVGQFTSLTSGSVKLVAEEYNKSREDDIVTDGYAILSRIYAGTKYKVYVYDAEGNEYMFNYAISDDTAGIDWYINDEFGNIVVPSGFDDDLYIGVVMSVE